MGGWVLVDHVFGGAVAGEVADEVVGGSGGVVGGGGCRGGIGWGTYVGAEVLDGA